VSTILKALRRLEEEKSRGTTSRPLREEVASGPIEPPRRRLPWLPIAAMLVGAGLGASAWWFWPYERGGEPVREVAEATPASPDAVTQVAETHVTRRVPPGFNDAAAQIESQLHGLAHGGAPDAALDPVTSPDGELAAGGPPEDAFASAVEVVERPAPQPRIAPVAPGTPQPRVLHAPAHVPEEPPAVTARRARPPVLPSPEAPAEAIAAATQRQQAAASPDPVTEPPPPHPVEQATPKPQARPAAPRPTATAARASEPPAPEPAPRTAQPAPERVVKKSAPVAVSPARSDDAVRVKRTQWHPEPSRRSADLDVDGRSTSVHEGDVVGDYVVTEIRPSGVVLTRDGQRVERGIGKQAP
jgi:hypothetical protein